MSCDKYFLSYILWLCSLKKKKNSLVIITLLTAPPGPYTHSRISQQRDEEKRHRLEKLVTAFTTSVSFFDL